MWSNGNNPREGNMGVLRTKLLYRIHTRRIRKYLVVSALFGFVIIREYWIRCCNFYSVFWFPDFASQTHVIDFGLTPFSTISQSYNGGMFTYPCVSWLSHTSTPHNMLSKQLAALSTWTVSQLVEV